MPPRKKSATPVAVEGNLVAEFKALRVSGTDTEIALSLARVLDSVTSTGAEKASCARALVPLLERIRESAEVGEGSWLDELQERRARRQAS